MAIFTSKADADLPILTRIYQLDLNSETEVVSFAEGEGYPENAERLRLYFYYEAKDDGKGDGWVSVGHEYVYDMSRALSTMQMLAVAAEVLDDLCDHGGVRRGHYRAMAKESLNKVFEGEPGDGYDPGELIPLDDFARERETLTARTLRELVSLMQRMRDGYQLARCADCQSVFLPVKAKQMYCSHRCADRVSARRRKIAAK